MIARHCFRIATDLVCPESKQLRGFTSSGSTRGGEWLIIRLIRSNIQVGTNHERFADVERLLVRERSGDAGN